MNDGRTRSEIIRVVIDSVKVVRPDVPVVDADTCLAGPHAILDSVGLVTVLVAVEEGLDNSVDLSAVLMDQDASEERTDPFSTVGRLADLIGELLSKR